MKIPATGACRFCGCREDLIRAPEAARLLATPVNTLSDWRVSHRYPLPYVKVGRNVAYCPGCVRVFIERQTVSV
jgi:hypothetical protein